MQLNRDPLLMSTMQRKQLQLRGWGVGGFIGETDVDGEALKPQMLSAETVAVCNREGGAGGWGSRTSAKRN